MKTDLDILIYDKKNKSLANFKTIQASFNSHENKKENT